MQPKQCNTRTVVAAEDVIIAQTHLMRVSGALFSIELFNSAVCLRYMLFYHSVADVPVFMVIVLLDH